MRFALVLICVLLTSACELRVREPSPEEKNQIINEVLALTDEVRAAAEAADADGLFRYHSDALDATHIIDGKRFTRSQMVSNYRNVYAGVASQQINLGQPVARVLSADLVLVVSQGNFTTQQKSGGSLSGDIAWTYLWQKQNDAWILLHAHQSFPGPIAQR